MKAFRALLRVSLAALLRSIAPGRGGAALALGLTALLPLLLSLSLGGVFGMALSALGALDLLPAFLCLTGAGMAFMFTAFGAGGVLFGGRDNDLLLALPVPGWMLLAGRLLAVYLENLLVFGLTLIPGMALYAAFGGAPQGLALAAAVALPAALVPTVLAALVGWAITWLTGRARHRALWANLGYGAVLLGSMALSFGINFSTRAAGGADTAARALASLFTGPLWLFGRMGAACLGDAAAFGVTLLAGVLPAALFVWLLQGSYRTLLARMGARAARKAYRMAAQRSAAPLAALLRKELARYLNTPVYLFNTGFGLILLAAATVFACWQGDRFVGWLAGETGLPLAGPDLYGVMAATDCLLLATASTACVSFSLEGRSFWLLKSLPLPAGQVIGAKVGFNLLAAWPLTAVCVAAQWAALGFGPLQGAALLLVTTALAACVSLGGAAANLRFPRLDAANDTVVCKQSLSAMVGFLGGMALAGAGIGLYLGALRAMPLPLYLLGCTAALAALCLVLAAWLRTVGARRLQQLS